MNNKHYKSNGIYGEDIKEERFVSKMRSAVIKKYDTLVSVIHITKDLSTLSALEMIGLFKVQKQRDKNKMDQSSSEKAFQASQNGMLKNMKPKTIINYSSSKERKI